MSYNYVYGLLEVKFDYYHFLYNYTTNNKIEALIATFWTMITSEEDEPTAPVGQLSPLKERLAKRRRALEAHTAQAARLWDPKRTRNVVPREGAWAGAGAGAGAGSTGVEEEYESLDEYTSECQNYLGNEVYFAVIKYEVEYLFKIDPDMYNNLDALLKYVTREDNLHVTTTLESWPSEYIVALAHTLKFISIGFDFNKLEDGYVTGDYLESLGISLHEMEDDYNEDYGGHCLKVVERHMGHCYRIGFDNGKHLSTREEFAREFLQPNNAYDFTITSTFTEC